MDIINSYKRNGFKYLLHLASPTGYIYSINFNSKVIGYEVFKHRLAKAGTSLIEGKEVEFKETNKLPSDEAFGKWAWTYNDLASSIEKFKSL